MADDILEAVKFAGKIKEGFNVKPNETDCAVTLSAVQEIRVVKCEMDSQRLNMSDEFLEAVNSLMPFNSSVRDSVNEWVVFFNKFGSHLVTQAYGGGSMKGFLSLSFGNNFPVLGSNKTEMEKVLNGILEFSNSSIPNLGSPFYRFEGGDPTTEWNSFLICPWTHDTQFLKNG